MRIPRIYHPWDKWECYKAGFFNMESPFSKDATLIKYSEFFLNLNNFKYNMDRVARDWPNSCEQFLSNPNFNRVAWLGQASVCISIGIPSNFKSGFRLLSKEDQTNANDLAKSFLNDWLSEKIKDLNNDK